MTRRLIDQDRLREHRRQDRLFLVLERRFRRAFAVEIARATRAMVADYTATNSAPSLPITHEAKIKGIFDDVAKTAITVFAGRVLDQGKSAGLVVETKDFAEVFARLAVEYLAKEAIRARITNISETTRQNVVATIIAGQADGLGTSVIARNLASNISGMSLFRGAMIARTETHGAANFGADGAARSTGLDLDKEWVASQDERTRASHANADGQIVGMNDTFDVGGSALLYPSDPNGPPEETINCRCTVAHIVHGF